MTTISMLKTETVTRTATAEDVRDVATAIVQEILALSEFYGKNFPYALGRLIKDIGLLLLFDMTAKIAFEFFEMVNGQRVERLSYAYLPKSVPGAVNSEPGDFPRREILPSWQVRLISYYPPAKPVSEVREFYEQLGWLPVDPLTRTGQGTTEEYGVFVSKAFSVAKEFYSDPPDKHKIIHKELTAHEIN
jgi:hypothetical protein